MMGDEFHKFGRCRPDRNDFGSMGFGNSNSSSRHIYLTFPADSTFTEEDVSNYFRTCLDRFKMRGTRISKNGCSGLLRLCFQRLLKRFWQRETHTLFVIHGCLLSHIKKREKYSTIGPLSAI
ncbi:hypothetical protein HanXRQr2_Chr01g0001361 [Helianthus annuus]|uniref:Uncharacterized protein n=1 Tax=Helianthus annuus TaxID=4232 RepID=A0A9K3JRB8_HELAN|nr:hypothetical protein HanXRQr2_Chr01g0001361 [Helianthus annuus]KAJ0955304.1 hypothetical protein HanPSC8_Chr01g0001341 [Helianthus annuus]